MFCLPSGCEWSGDIQHFEYKSELDPYTKGVPAAMEEKLSRRYEAIFKLFLKHRDKIERVTT